MKENSPPNWCRWCIAPVAFICSYSFFMFVPNSLPVKSVGDRRAVAWYCRSRSAIEWGTGPIQMTAGRMGVCFRATDDGTELAAAGLALLG